MKIEKLHEAVEECVGVMGNTAFKGSYAAPREAFRKILTHVYTAAIEDAKGVIPEEEKEAGERAEAGDAFYDGFDRGWNKARAEALNRLDGLLK